MSTDYTKETQLWRGTPSQWTNIGAYLAAFIGAAAIVIGYVKFQDKFALTPAYLGFLVIPVFYAFLRWLQTRSNVYEVTTERVRVSTGLLSRRTAELELYRVRDYTVEEPFTLRMIGLGNLVLTTADRTSPTLVLRAIPNVTALKDQIRTHTERMRKLRGVRDLEIDPR